MPRRWTLVAALLLASLSFAGVASARTSAAEPAARGHVPGFYLGRIAFEDDVIGIAVNRAGNVKVLVTDAEPNGDAEWFEGKVKGKSKFKSRSVSGNSRLQVTFDRANGICTGTIKMPNGETRGLAANLANEGAGIYTITVGNGHYSGKSTTGDTVEADLNGHFLEGALTEKDGTESPFQVMDLSQAFQYSIKGAQSDTYTAIISRNAKLHYGRGGAVRRGRPSKNLIAFDIPTTDDPTPGFYFGRIGFENDVIGIQIDDPEDDGTLRVRAYESDSEPGGDIQWFPGTSDGSTFNIISASGDAQLQGTIVGELISGTISFPDKRVRRFFALPAGQGAGIYDVTVNKDGSFTGASEEGGTLTGQQDGVFIDLSITAPGGEVFSNNLLDLTRALDYGFLGNQPDTYVAIVSPRGRWVFGRSGDVRGGSAGLNIIGLDMET